MSRSRSGEKRIEARPGARAAAWLSCLALLLARCGTGPPASAQQASPAPGTVTRGIAALGRVQPKDGIIRVAAPSIGSAVVARLRVAPGDRVEQGQVIAVLDQFQVLEGAVAQAQAGVAAREAGLEGLRVELVSARNEQRRYEKLYADGFVSASERDQWTTRGELAARSLARAERELEVARAELQRARLDRDRTLVRSPIRGQVLKIQAQEGEKVGDAGIAELARTDEMYVVAEVYEADITRVRVGQRAIIRSPLLKSELHGTVERIGRTIGKKDVLGTDPAARADVRVVEVEIRLDDGAPVSGLTHLTVEVEIAG